MLNLEEINNTIQELENGTTTFDNCLKLASLYIVQERYKNGNLSVGNDNTVNEYKDILPKYHEYVEIKTKFQSGEESPTAIERSIKGVCQEIKEFLEMFYNCTDMQIERDCIKDMISNLKLQ